MCLQYPLPQWTPLSLPEAVAVFADAPFQWFLGGGYAVEQFLPAPIRAHGDIDVVIFRDQQLQLQRWLDGWCLFAADPPGALRLWQPDEYLPFGIHDIWGYRQGADAWQIQWMLAEVDGDEWFYRKNAQIRGKRSDLIAHYKGLPCTRIEVQLMFKAKGRRPRDEQDFQAALPLMSSAAKIWLRDSLRLLYPDGHPWLADL